MFLLGLLVALAYCNGIIDAAIIPRWSVLAVGIPLLLLFSKRWIDAPLRGWGAIAMVLVMISISWSPDRLGGIDDGIHLAIFGMAFILGVNSDDISGIWKGIAVGVAASAVIAVLEYFKHVEWFAQVVPPAGLFMNRNLMAEAALVATLALGSLPLKNRWQILLPFTLVAMIWPLSKAVIGAFILIIALVIGKMAAKYRSTLLTLVTSLIFIGLGVEIYRHLGDPTAVQRFGFWKEALSDFKSFGHGLGSFTSRDTFAEFTHNEYLQAIYELGFLAIPLFSILGIALWRGLQNEECNTEFRILLAICGVAIFSFPFHMPLTGFAAALAAGHLVGFRDRLWGLGYAQRDDIGRCKRTQYGRDGSVTTTGPGSQCLPAKPPYQAGEAATEFGT